LSPMVQAQPSFRSAPAGHHEYQYGRFEAEPDPLHLTEFQDEFDNLLKICVVKQHAQRRRTSALIERRYAWRGYSATPLPTTSDGKITLSALIDGGTVATITAGLDSDQGLYVSALYPDAVGRLRAEGRKLCEFTKLAVDESIRSPSILGAIFHVACIYAIEMHRCTDVLIEVNPRHVRFYERMLGFAQAAEERLDPEVNAPAVLLRLDLGHCAREIERLGGRRDAARAERSFYPHFFAPEKAAEVIDRLRMH
jgi:hypothetical protein